MDAGLEDVTEAPTDATEIKKPGKGKGKGKRRKVVAEQDKQVNDETMGELKEEMKYESQVDVKEEEAKEKVAGVEAVTKVPKRNKGGRPRKAVPEHDFKE